MNHLVTIQPSMQFGNWNQNQLSWAQSAPVGTMWLPVYNVSPITKAYQQGYEEACRYFDGYNILGFVHDDVTCLDPEWHEKIMREFNDPLVGLVGMGGSEGHGDPNIYRSPYAWEQVGRTGRFMSALVNAEQHGSRIDRPANASFVDGFALFVRRQILDVAGGWPQDTPIQYFGYDMWLCCETRRQGFKIRVAPVVCEHTCPPEYRSYVLAEPAEVSHKYLYENYRDTFPAMVVNNA